VPLIVAVAVVVAASSVLAGAPTTADRQPVAGTLP